MDKRLIKRLELWYENEEFDKIIAKILEIPEDERGYHMTSQLARAYNNIELYQEAMELLISIKKEGINDHSWHFRIAYSYFFLGNFKKALEEFKIAIDLGDKEPLTKLFLEMSESNLFLEKNYLEEDHT
ncbi:MAG: hypothetical protein LBM26_02080 [Methanobrevibacter sp.]|nr:hypothetical protein [Methanobrevibacter sp.]